MLDTQSTLQSTVIDLAGDAFTGFCEDIGGMFGVDMSCDQVNVAENPVAEIKKHYKKVATVYSVESTGSFDGEFKIFFDRAGLFTMAGVVVMLPESRILSNAKRGTLANVDEMADAVGEVGNLLVGCWDRIFRNGLEDKIHFSHTGTFIGDLSKEGNEGIDLTAKEEATFVSFEMSVGEYPSFQCGVYFPARLLEEAKSEPEPEPEPEQEQEPEPKLEAEPKPEPEPKTEVEPKPASQEVIEPEAKEEVVSEPESKPEPKPEIESKAGPQEVIEPEEDVLVVAEPDTSEDAAVSEPTKPEPEPALVPSSEPQENVAVTDTVDPVAVTSESVPGNSAASLLARHLMQTDVHWISVDDTVDQAQTKMQQIGVSYLLVGDGSKLDGIVTQSDLASAASIYLRPIFAKWRRPEDDATLQIRIKWIMSKQIYTVKVETPLTNIIHLTCKYDISCLPVVDVQGKVLGVVTTKDVFKAIVSHELSTTGVMVA
jgi:CBS domain-containing protein